MKKKVLIIIGILVLIIVAVVGLVVLNKEKEYTLDEVKELVEKGNVIPSNVFLNTEYFDKDGKSLGKVESYIKDKLKVTKQYSGTNIVAENYLNEETAELVTIIHKDKMIFIHSNYPVEDEINNEFLYSVSRNEKNENLGIYSYIGKEKVNNRKCIKVSLTDKDVTNNTELVINYYIDEENGRIIKIENLKDNVADMVLVNTYEDNAITDDKDMKFNKENYKDYTVAGE